MKCVRCPLYHFWNNESGRGEECGLFGDGWNSQFQYEDEHGIVGCYIDRHYIQKVDDEYDKQYDEVEVISERGVFVHCFRCGNDEYAMTEAEAVEKWNFLAKLKAKLQSGEITVSEAEHEYHDRYLKD